MRILLVCMGNTLPDNWEIDSVAYGIPTLNRASKEAREAIKIKYSEDLLASPQPRRITPELIQWADIVLVMSGWMKQGLPQNKTFTLKEFAGGSGDISDPFGQGIAVYLPTG
jgi:protein-tyrosine-phosphatase